MCTPFVFLLMKCLRVFVSIHLSVESFLVVLSWSGHLSEQLSLTLGDILIHTVQLKPSPVINYALWTCKHNKTL